MKPYKAKTNNVGSMNSKHNQLGWTVWNKCEHWPSILAPRKLVNSKKSPQICICEKSGSSKNWDNLSLEMAK